MSDVITNTFLICNFPTYLLFDLGATRSFVSNMFMSKLGKNLEPLVEEIIIYNLVDDIMLVSEALRGCEELVESVSLSMDLLPLELLELDVILGIDFLHAHFSSIYSERKEVVFRKPKFQKLLFRGQKNVVPSYLISTLKVVKLLRKWCPTFLAHVLAMHGEKLREEDVLVVRDYLDVFPKEVLGLPPDKGMEFTI